MLSVYFSNTARVGLYLVSTEQSLVSYEHNATSEFYGQYHQQYELNHYFR